MTRTGLLTLATISAVVLAFVLYTKSHPAPTTDSISSSGSAVATAKKSDGSLLSLRRLVSAPLQNNALDSSRLSPECTEFQAALLAISIQQIEFPPKIDRLPAPRGCSLPSSRSAKALHSYVEKCAASFEATTKTGNTPDEKFLQGQVATILLRSTLAAESRPPRALGEIDDLRELADLLISEFGDIFSGTATADTGKDLKAIADRMNALNPELLSTVKAGAIGSILEAAISGETARAKGEAPPNTDWKSLEDRVRRLEELDPNDPELDRYRRMVDTEMMTPDLVKRDSLARLAKNPGAWYEHELIAWADFKMGRRADARSSLATALAMQPKDPGLNRNWAVVNRPDSQPNDFKVEMQFGLGFDDLLK